MGEYWLAFGIERGGQGHTFRNPLSRGDGGPDLQGPPVQDKIVLFVQLKQPTFKLGFYYIIFKQNEHRWPHRFNSTDLSTENKS